MSQKNRVVIAAAGSGKTTYLALEALKVKDGNVLITTYTESNEAEIKKKIIAINGSIPSNVTIMTWFTFLIHHAVKPFQGGLFEFLIKGMLLVSNRSGLRFTTPDGRPVYWAESDFARHYFDGALRIYSDKLSKLAIRCNAASDGAVFGRIARIFQHVFVDEVQDLAGYDLDVVTSLFQSSARVLLVGDPRQVTYLTHHEAKYGKYADGKLILFLKEKLPKKIAYEVDDATLNVSHRSNEKICTLSSQLYADMTPSKACSCYGCRSQVGCEGLHIVRPVDYAGYLEAYKPIQLRDNIKTRGIDLNLDAINFGQSKGLGFDRVVILPTADMLKWLSNRNHSLAPITRAKFYVALTRARYSVGIVADWGNDQIPSDFSLFNH